MKQFIRKRGKSLALLTVAGALAFSSLGTALATTNSQASQAKQGLFGTATAKTANSFTLTTSQGTKVDLSVTADTRFRAPGDLQVSLADLAVGSRVAVLAQGGSALKVTIIPAEPQREHRVLTVTDISGRTLTAQDAEGNKVTIELDHDVSADIKGQLVTFIGARSAQSDRFKANVEVKINQVVKRLEDHAKKVEAEGKAEASAEGKARKERQFAELKARLEANMQRHLDLLAQIIARAPEQAKPALKAALEASLKGFKAELEALGAVKADIEATLDLRTANGTVESFDAAKGELTVVTENGVKLMLKVNSETKVRIDEKEGKLADLAVGERVQVRFNSDSSLVSQIRIKTEAEARGIIKSVDTASPKLVIMLDNGATLTLAITASTKIEINDRMATIADLKANARVEVKFNSTTLEAQKIEVETKGKIEGTIKAVDATAGTVTITGEDGKDVTLKVADATRIIIRGVLQGVLGLSAGQKVEATFDLTTNVATEIKAKAEREGKPEERNEARVIGTVGGVDVAKGQITISLDDGGTITLTANAQTEVKVDGKAAALSNVRVGDRVRAEYDVNTKVAEEIETTAKAESKATVEKSASGTLKAVDVVGRTVTIATDKGDLTLKVVGESKIVVKEKVTDLAVLVTGSVGAKVDVKYNAESNTLILMTIK